MATDSGSRRRRNDARHRHNKEFFERLQERHPEAKASLERVTAEVAAGLVQPLGEEAAAGGVPLGGSDELALETLVRRERPVLFVQDDWINKVEVTIDGIEAQELINLLDANRS